MHAPLEFRSLPLAERLQLVEAIWDSIAEDQNALSDHPNVVKEVQERKARLMANPSLGVPWETAKKDIRAGRGYASCPGSRGGVRCARGV
jgi:putative addiction module component (TIGR02574 family)